jgi:hypothetical protein
VLRVLLILAISEALYFLFVGVMARRGRVGPGELRGLIGFGAFCAAFWALVGWLAT